MKQNSIIIHLVFLLFASFLAFNGCDKESVVEEHLYHEYFPVNVGHWVVYDVDSIVYDDFTGEIDTFNYQVKEVFDSNYTDASGNESIRLERFIRNEPGAAWEIKNAWSARRLPARAEKVEENIRYIKLAFPPKINKTWNGNAYNIKDEQSYRITNIHKEHTINELSFDSVATVLHIDEQTLISEKYRVEKFAKNVGLIKKEYVDLEKEVDGNIVSGVDYKYRVVDYFKGK